MNKRTIHINGVKLGFNNAVFLLDLINSTHEKYKKEDRTPTFISKNVLKGTVIHKLLEILPNIKPENREEIIKYYMKNFTNEFTLEEGLLIKEKIFEVLEQKSLKDLFGENSKSEVSKIGRAHV